MYPTGIATMETVLFVDDEAMVLDYLGCLFHNEGVRVLRAADGAEALEIVQREEVAVLVTDYLLPVIDGLELIARVKALSAATVPILMSGVTDLPKYLETWHGAPLFCHLEKPWKGPEMLTAVKQGVQRFRELRSRQRHEECLIHSLGRLIDRKDGWTRGHCERVADYALLIADALQLPEQERQEIQYGSWLHDCGKIRVPAAILNAERLLTPEEFAIVRMHPVWGVEIAGRSRLPERVITIVMSHHERLDGQGYPHGLSGPEIPLEARIVAIADVYDALSSDRPYRPAFPAETVRTMVAQMAGSALDPELVRLFFRQLDRQRLAVCTLAPATGQPRGCTGCGRCRTPGPAVTITSHC